MVTVTFYEKPGCANNARQKAVLRQAGHAVDARNLLTESWSAETLRPFFGNRPVAEWFNRAAPRVKTGEVVPEQMTEAEAIAAMLTDPLLIRRPLLEVDGRRTAGFDAGQIEVWLGLTARDDLETCRRTTGTACADDRD